MDNQEDVLVSVITVCYNSEMTMEDTIKSVLQQTYHNIEYIIIDGGSKDKTLDILKQYEPAFRGRMKITSEPDQGIYDAMNKGIRKAKGELIGILNSDDFYEPDAVETMVHAYRENKTDYMILYGFQRNLRHNQFHVELSDNVSENQLPKGSDEEISVVLFHHDYLKQQMITHPTCFVTGKVYEKYGVFNTDYQSSADYEFMLRVQAAGGVTFLPVYKIITNFRMGGMSSGEKGYRETARLRYQYGAISKMRMWKIIMKSKLYEWVHK